MIRRSAGRMLMLFALMAAATLVAQGVPAVFSPSHYYILSLGDAVVDVPDLLQRAQSASFSTVQYEGETRSIDRGSQDPEVSLEEILADAAVLIVDAGRVHMTCRQETYSYTVRPSAAGGYELVIRPTEDLSVIDTLSEILLVLQELAVVGDEVDLRFSAHAKDDPKGSVPPGDLAIESPLYQLTVAEDWLDYTAVHDLVRVGLRVTVVAELLPGETLDPAFSPFVDQEGVSLVRLLLPIDQLWVLARSDAVGYVRTPRPPFVP